jgi:hypothetical protein
MSSQESDVVSDRAIDRFGFDVGIGMLKYEGLTPICEQRPIQLRIMRGWVLVAFDHAKILNARNRALHVQSQSPVLPDRIRLPPGCAARIPEPLIVTGG